MFLKFIIFLGAKKLITWDSSRKIVGEIDRENEVKRRSN